VGFGFVDEIVPEPLGGAHRDPGSVVSRVLEAIDASLTELAAMDASALLEARYRKYRRIGAWQGERLETVRTRT